MFEWFKSGMSSVLAHQADDKTDYGHDGENEEQDFGDFNGTCRDPAKAEDGSDQRDHQKNYRIVQHLENSLQV